MKPVQQYQSACLHALNMKGGSFQNGLYATPISENRWALWLKRWFFSIYGHCWVGPRRTQLRDIHFGRSCPDLASERQQG